MTWQDLIGAGALTGGVVGGPSISIWPSLWYVAIWVQFTHTVTVFRKNPKATKRHLYVCVLLAVAMDKPFVKPIGEGET